MPLFQQQPPRMNVTVTASTIDEADLLELYRMYRHVYMSMHAAQSTPPLVAGSNSTSNHAGSHEEEDIALEAAGQTASELVTMALGLGRRLSQRMDQRYTHRGEWVIRDGVDCYTRQVSECFSIIIFKKPNRIRVEYERWRIHVLKSIRNFRFTAPVFLHSNMIHIEPIDPLPRSAAAMCGHLWLIASAHRRLDASFQLEVGSNRSRADKARKSEAEAKAAAAAAAKKSKVRGQMS